MAAITKPLDEKLDNARIRTLLAGIGGKEAKDLTVSLNIKGHVAHYNRQQAGQHQQPVALPLAQAHDRSQHENGIELSQRSYADQKARQPASAPGLVAGGENYQQGKYDGERVHVALEGQRDDEQRAP